MRLIDRTAIACICLSEILLNSSLWAFQSAQAATELYVSTTGSNSNPGSLTQPLATLQEALYRANPGTSIFLRGGFYNLSKGVWIGPNESGTSTAPITIQPYQQEKPVLDGSVMTTAAACIGTSGHDVIIKGLECRNSPAQGIMVVGGYNIKILYNIVHHIQAAGIVSFAESGQTPHKRSNNIWIEGNEVYLTNLKNSGANKGKVGWDQGIEAMETDNATITSNLVYSNYGEGIGCILANKCVASRNTVYNNYSVEMYLDNATNSTFNQNFIMNTGDPAFYRELNGVMQPASGIQMANENYGTTSWLLNNNGVRNNIVIGGSSGFFYGAYSALGVIQPRGMKNTQVVNNTFYKSTKELLHIDADPNNYNNTFSNNIFYQVNGQYMTYIPSTLNLVFRRNLWFGGNPNSSAIADGIIGKDPLFVNPGGYVTSDYKLKSGSPAINAGTSMNAATYDYFLTKRPINTVYDIGAHEFVSP
jgi:hypothetical protein